MIFAAGIDPFQSNPAACPPVNSNAGCYDPYEPAAYTFSPIITALRCNSTPDPGGVMVPCPRSNIGWIPYSYAGLAEPRPAPYTGAQTGQAPATSAARMQELVDRSAVGRRALAPR